MNGRIAMLKNRKGVTLVEILVAFAILSVIAAAFLLLFSTSITNIFNFGAESRAVARTTENMEALYNLENPTGTDIEAELDAMNGKKALDSTSLYDYDSNFNFNYYYEGSDTGLSSGYEVTMVMFYRNGEKYVDLKSFIRSGD